MKLVVSYIQHHKRYDVSEAIRCVPGMTGMTVMDVLGCGKQHIESEQKHPDRFIGSFDKHCRIEVLCANEGVASDVVNTIEKTAHTGLPGDGVIFVSPVDEAVRISTGERGDAAVV